MVLRFQRTIPNGTEYMTAETAMQVHSAKEVWPVMDTGTRGRESVASSASARASPAVTLLGAVPAVAQVVT